MTMQNDAGQMPETKFAIGQPVPRSEDPMLVRGEGRFTDDVSVAGQALCGDGAQPPRPRHHQQDRHRRRRAR